MKFITNAKILSIVQKFQFWNRQSRDYSSILNSIVIGNDKQGNLPSALRLASSLGANDNNGLKLGLSQLSIRTIETYLISHKEIVNVANYWDFYLGRQEEEVAKALKKILGEPAPVSLIEYIVLRIDTHSKRSHRDHVTDTRIELALNLLWGQGQRELRCCICGFHFRSSDMHATKLAIVTDIGFELDTNISARRQSDPLKPVERPPKPGKDPLSYTSLQFDHVVPRSGLGPSVGENLQPVCSFCNWGKQSYRFPLEGISGYVSLALDRIDGTENWSVLEDVIVGAIRFGGQCSVTGKLPLDTELTVRPTKNAHHAPTWYMPWAFEVVSYDVYNPVG